MFDLPLTKLSENDDTVTLGWTPPSGVEWYTLYANYERVSNHAPISKDGVVYRQTRFDKGKEPMQVVATVRTSPDVFDVAVGTYKTVVTPPPPTGKPPAFRTNYDKLNLGSNLDPLWWYKGSPSGAKHCGPGATIEIVNDPAGAKGHVQRHIVLSGSVLWGGDRCEVMSTSIGGGMGARFQVCFDLLLPIGFKSGSGGWNSLWDLHYPNNGPAQSPLMAQIRNGADLWMRVMAPNETNDKLATLKQGVWNTIAHDIYQHDKNGFIDTWVNGVKVGSFKGSTLQAGVPNTTYWKQGFYRAPNSSEGTQTMYFDDTLCWFESSPDAMLLW